MNITGEGIFFESLSDLKIFLSEYKLSGAVKLSEPLMDNKGNILIKENLYVKDSAITKLESMDGQYKPDFKVLITSELLKSIRTHIGNKIANRLDETKNEFLIELYKNTTHNYKGYIQHSIQSKTLALSMLKLEQTRPRFFTHASEFALLCLGILIQKSYRIRFIHRYAFLAGLLADISLAGSDKWQQPITSESEKRSIAQKGSELAEKMRTPPEVTEAILNHPVQVLPFPTDPKAPLGSAGEDDNILEEFIDADEPFDAEMKVDEKAAMIITEALKIARFINDSTLLISDKEHYAEELVYRVAYNAAKGYFHNELINPILKRFKQYEENVKRLIKIAEIERQCIHPPSAWAYPKPKATQIVCQNRIMNCPKIISGWDINIISSPDAVGWIGASLEPGDYPKCKLESLLEGNQGSKE